MTPKSAQRALTVDAFAFGELQGNPAAVVLATEPIHEDDMSDQARSARKIILAVLLLIKVSLLQTAGSSCTSIRLAPKRLPR